MSPLLLAAFVLVAWEFAGRPLPQLSARSATWAPKRSAVVVAAMALVAAFAGRLALLVYQAGHDGSHPAFFATLPFFFVDDVYAVFPPGPEHGRISLEALGVAAAETCALGTLVLEALRNPERSLALRLAPYIAVALALLAIFAPVLSSNDVFGYIGLGMLGSHAYLQPGNFFTGEYARLFDQFPIRPTIYGPLWVGLNSAVVALGTTLFTKVLALRAFGAVLIVLLALLARGLGCAPAVRVALLINPMLWLEFVANAHNDLIAVVLVVAALLAVARNRPVWAVAAVAAAGLVKLPFLVLGAAVLARAPSRRAAIGLLAAATVLCLGVSAVFGGHAYLDALMATVRLRGSELKPGTAVLKGATLALALLGTAYALVRGRYLAFVGWLYPVLGPIVFPWYFAWTIPYALAARRLVIPTLLGLPVAGTLSDTIYGLDPVAMFALYGALGTLIVTTLFSNTRRVPRSGSLEASAAVPAPPGINV